jgi:hypothetical protein
MNNNPWDISTPEPSSLMPLTSTKPDWLTDEIATALVDRNLPLDKDGMLMLWQHSQKALAQAKENEMDYRKICVNLLIPKPVEGMNNVELGGGFVAKAQIKYNYKLDSDNDKVWAGLTKIENLGNEGKFVAERLVSWTPNFLLTEYRQLQEDAEKGSQFAKDALKVINEFLTITDAAPTLEIREPKKKK